MQSLLQTIVIFVWQILHCSHTYPMIMLPYLCGFWVHINLSFAMVVERFFLEFPVNTPSLSTFSSMETAVLLHISRHLSYDMQMPRRNSFWIIVFALMVISFNPTYNGNGVSRFLRCLRFANEVSLVCAILDCFLYENIISWETDKATRLTWVGVGSVPSISNEHKLKIGNGMNSSWQLTGKFPWKELVTSDIYLRIGRTTFSSAFAWEDWFISFNLFFTRWSISSDYDMVFLRSSFWSLNSGRASSKHSVNRKTWGETRILSDLRSSLYMDCNSATIKENFQCMLHCSFIKCMIFQKCNSSKKFSDELSVVAVSCFIAAEYLLLNCIKHFLW